MTFDLWMLSAAAFIGLVHVSLQGLFYKAQVGNAFSVGARDSEPAATGFAGRMARAQRNFLESFPLFAAAVLVAHASGKAGTLSAAGSALYVAARALYIPAYAAGIPYVRTIIWQAAMIGLVIVLAAPLLT
jgi:uncharacterized MAPEG superfamily protein